QELVKTKGHYPLNASWTNARLAAQMGTFTLQAGTEPVDERAQRTKGEDPKLRFLLKVWLKPDSEGKCLARAWQELQYIGVEERYLFPERENLTHSIKEHRGLEPIT